MKKKTNPNRIPVTVSDDDIQEILHSATDGMVLRAWAVVLAAMAGFYETTADSMLNFWEYVSAYRTELSDLDDVERELKRIKETLAIDLSIKRVQSSTIRTRGDLARFTERTRNNGFVTAISIIAEATLEGKYFAEDFCRDIFHKAIELNEDIEEGRISLQDIQNMLIDEYSVRLEGEGNAARLAPAGE